jgi:hypothetical protein
MRKLSIAFGGSLGTLASRGLGMSFDLFRAFLISPAEISFTSD